MRPGPLGRKVDTAGRRTSEGSVIQAKGVDGGGRTGKIDLLKDAAVFGVAYAIGPRTA